MHAKKNPETITPQLPLPPTKHQAKNNQTTKQSKAKTDSLTTLKKFSFDAFVFWILFFLLNFAWNLWKPEIEQQVVWNMMEVVLLE